jgi:fumarylpyruvate hydrolase
MSGQVLPAIPETVVPVADGGVFPVRRIYCVGRNYLDHIREMKEADERDPPFFFQKPRDAIVPTGATVAYPPLTSNFQFEGELVMAIGKTGRDIPVDHALDHVFGYSCGLDMTRRDRQFDARDNRLPWEVGKSFDESAPCGVITPSSKGHRLAGALVLSVNGKERQRGDLSHMIWSPPEIIAQLSRQVTLEAGDLIFTGTPAGVGAVVPGDSILLEIEGLTPLTIAIGEPDLAGASQ